MAHEWGIYMMNAMTYLEPNIYPMPKTLHALMQTKYGVGRDGG